MKKSYMSPEIDIEKFYLSSTDVITTSGQGGGDEEIEIDF